MKKFLKTLLMITTPVIAAPVVFSLTSCGALDGTVRLYDDIDNLTDESRYGQLPISNKGLKEIIYGSKGFYKGNYSLVFGSNYYDKTMEFLFNEKAQHKTDVVNQAKMDQSLFVKAISDYKVYNPVDFEKGEIGFASYMDIQVLEKDAQDIVSPFSQWTKVDENEDENHKEGKFKREDNSAKKFRSFIDTIKILFGEEKFSEENLENNVWAIFWKDGIPVKIEDSLTKDKYFNSLNEVYKTKK